MITRALREKILHRGFQIGVLFKGLDGFLETAGGFVFLVLSKGTITRFFSSLTRSEFLEDPDDWFARSLRHAFSHLSGNNKLFVGAYLLGHGLIKLFLVIGLWRDKLWVFPIAVLMLLAFIGYQIFRVAHHFSIGLIFATVADGIILALIYHEYRSKRKK